LKAHAPTYDKKFNAIARAGFRRCVPDIHIFLLARAAEPNQDLDGRDNRRGRCGAFSRGDDGACVHGLRRRYWLRPSLLAYAVATIV